VPDLIKESELTRRQDQIKELWDCIKNQDYQTTKEHKQYAKEYTKKHNAYWDMWKV
jgi:predicted membrane chloride channel (bestrophin family)